MAKKPHSSSAPKGHRVAQHPAHSIRRALAAAREATTEPPPYDVEGELDKALSLIERHGVEAMNATVCLLQITQYGLQGQLCERLAQALHEVHQTLQRRLFLRCPEILGHV